MKNVLSNIGRPFQFTVRRDAVYSFDTEEAIAISDSDYQTIADRIGANCMKIVDALAAPAAPVEVAPTAPVIEPAVVTPPVVETAPVEPSTTAPAAPAAPVVGPAAPLE